MTKEYKNKPAPFFIVGCQRSGTTLLSVLFEKHSQICMERKVVAFRLITCFKSLYELLPSNLKSDRSAFMKYLIENDLEGRLSALIDLENLESYANTQELIEGSINKKLLAEGKKIWGDKAPNAQHFVNDLSMLIPEAKFIHIIRDGRANAYSLSTRAYQNLALSAQQWVDGNAYGLVNQQFLGKERYHFVHYENLLKQPEEEAKAICDFLQLDYDENMLNLKDQQLQKKESYVKSFFDLSKIDKWKKQLTEDQIKVVENIQGPMLKTFGYELFTDSAKLNFKYLSLRQKIYYNQKDNLKQLFRSQRTGMVDKELVKLNVSLLSRIKVFLRTLAKDLLSKEIFMSLYRKNSSSNKVYTERTNSNLKSKSHESN